MVLIISPFFIDKISSVGNILCTILFIKENIIIICSVIFLGVWRTFGEISVYADIMLF